MDNRRLFEILRAQHEAMQITRLRPEDCASCQSIHATLYFDRARAARGDGATPEAGDA